MLPKDDALKPFYTIPELVKRWGVSRWTIYRLANDGRLRKSYVRGSVRFSRATIATFEKSLG